MAYKEIEPSDWKYEKDGDFIEGVLVGKKEDVGKNKCMLYNIENVEGVKNVWGATILDQRMSFTKIGDKIKITYKGLGEAKDRHNAPKLFKVEVDRE